MVSIIDVAKLAQVSKSTVSRVINQPDSVTEELRNRVQSAIKELDYRPNLSARSLVSNKTNYISLIIPDITNPYFPSLMRGVEDTAKKYGYTVIVSNSDNDRKSQEYLLSNMIEHRVAGIIFVSSEMGGEKIRKLTQSAIPFVLCDRVESEGKYDFISVDHFRLAQEVTNRLIAMGHQKIVHIAGPQNVSSSEQRAAGYRYAMEQAGLVPYVTESASFTYETGQTVMDQLLVSQTPTAVFAANDLIALGAIDSIKRKGLRIPEDISIIGCDDIPYSAMSSPKLSTMQLPSYEMGAEAMEMLHGKISGERTTIKHVYLDYTFVERETTRVIVNSQDIHIAVVGSVNMDYSTRLLRRPVSGETILGGNLIISPGGKGANQACAAARAGASVQMIGQVGDDYNGRKMKTSMERMGVSTAGISVSPTEQTGAALITLDQSAENSIIVCPGANGTVSSEVICLALDALPELKLIMLQLEIPMDCILQTITYANHRGIQVFLDPAPVPADGLPTQLYSMLDYISPNSIEAEMLTGIHVCDADSARKAAHFFLDRGVKNAIIKLGSQGVYAANADGEVLLPRFPVNAIDTTAAGDTFGGAFCARLVGGSTFGESLAFANAAGALSTTKCGAQQSMPSEAEILRFMQEQEMCDECSFL